MSLFVTLSILVSGERSRCGHPALGNAPRVIKMFVTHPCSITSTTPTLRLIPIFPLNTRVSMATVAVESYRADLQPQMAYQPPVAKLPRRKPIVRQPTSVPPPSQTYEGFKGIDPKPTQGRCRSMVVPGLYVAYKDEAENRLVVMEDGKRYTHAINICHSDERSSRLTTHLLPDGSNIDVLHLAVSHPDGVGRVGLGLTPEQLRSSVEFLSTAPPTDDAARTLVTCPTNHQTDVMCIVSAHLSSIIEEDVEDILKVIDMVEELHSAWKGEVSGEEAELIREVVPNAPCALS